MDSSLERRFALKKLAFALRYSGTGTAGCDSKISRIEEGLFSRECRRGREGVPVSRENPTYLKLVTDMNRVRQAS
jgi:hypothetical protein